MKIRLSYPNSNDQHYLVDTAKFMKLVDEDDLACRKSKEIKDSYHTHWFSEGDGSVIEFSPPAVYFSEAGIVKFINGRHRTLLLSKYLDNIPIAISDIDRSFQLSDSEKEECKRLVREIAVKEVGQSDVIEFPNLEIEYLGFDLNIGK